MRSHWFGTVVLSIPLFVAATWLNAVSVGAQSPDSTSPIQLIPRTKAQREQSLRSEHRISLIVQVTDSSANPVSGLKPEDFLVLDNQKQQKVTRFREVDGKTFTADIRVVVVLDAINDGGAEIGHLKRTWVNTSRKAKGHYNSRSRWFMYLKLESSSPQHPPTAA